MKRDDTTVNKLVIIYLETTRRPRDRDILKDSLKPLTTTYINKISIEKNIKFNKNHITNIIKNLFVICYNIKINTKNVVRPTRFSFFYIQLERSSKFIQKQIKFKIHEVLNDQEGYKIAKFILFNFAYMVILTCSNENLK